MSEEPRTTGEVGSTEAQKIEQARLTSRYAEYSGKSAEAAKLLEAIKDTIKKYVLGRIIPDNAILEERAVMTNEIFLGPYEGDVLNLSVVALDEKVVELLRSVPGVSSVESTPKEVWVYQDSPSNGLRISAQIDLAAVEKELLVQLGVEEQPDTVRHTSRPPAVAATNATLSAGGASNLAASALAALDTPAEVAPEVSVKDRFASLLKAEISKHVTSNLEVGLQFDEAVDNGDGTSTLTFRALANFTYHIGTKGMLANIKGVELISAEDTELAIPTFEAEGNTQLDTVHLPGSEYKVKITLKDFKDNTIPVAAESN